MKKGIFLIIQKGNRQVACVRRADGVNIELDIQVTPEIQLLNGKECNYHLKGDKVVIIEGRNIFQQQKPEIPKKEKKVPSRMYPLRNLSQEHEESIVNIKEVKDSVVRKLKDSYNIKKACVPLDTRSCLTQFSAVQNFYLKLNQFARLDIKDEEEQEGHFTFFNPKPIKKKKTKEEIVPAIQIKAYFGNLFNNDATQLSFRLFNAAKNLFPNANQLLETKFKPEWRFVAGLGGHSVYETGITLHHVYGVPYIPASTIKGVMRSWVIYSCFNNKEEDAIRDKDFCIVFGCPADKSFFKKAKQGDICFFDALPLSEPKIEPDIMNPHYSKWYSGKTGAAPTDNDSPNPVFFLTVKGTPFQFLFGSKKYDLNNDLFWNKKPLDWWLENALGEHGIGAKTAVGYGYMKKIE